jgi:septal ring factor EnvC (AmiA/AmiB activator)
MVRAIIVLTIVVVCSFAFVLLQLLMRAPAAASPSAPAAPMLRGTEDGGVISVDLMIQRLEKRVQDGEEQAAGLRKDLDDSRTESEALRQKVTGLEGEVRRLRRQLDQASQPPTQPDANAPRTGPPTGNPQPPLTTPETDSPSN